jgi:hypothetical protein
MFDPMWSQPACKNIELIIERKGWNNCNSGGRD